MKKCTKCGEEKQESDFYTKGKYLDARCKECVNEKRRWKDLWGEGLKGCGKCGEVKPLVEFDTEPRNTGSKGKGVASACKLCRRAGEAAWKQNNREHVNDYQKEYNRENRRKLTVAKFVRKTGIEFTAEQYDTLLATQGGVCAICGKPPKDKALHTDHDHQTGRVRSLLCNNCNNGLGRFRDSPELLEKAANYIRVHSS